MNPEVAYQTSIARINELQRQAASSRLAAQTARGLRRASNRRLWWRAGRSRRPSIVERYA